jgi:hypothetical protein
MKAKKKMGGEEKKNLPKKVKERPKSNKRKKNPKRNCKGYYFFKSPQEQRKLKNT